MKYIRNNQADGVLERLLRAEIGRASRTGAPCANFDPDFSTAYIERNLTPGEVARYEVHLAACSSCRIQVASLARIGYRTGLDQAAERMPAFDAVRKAQRSYLGLSRVFAYLLQPQGIAVATASLVLLVAVPIFLILKNAKQLQNARPAAPASSTANEALRDSAGAVNFDSRIADQEEMQSGSATHLDSITRSAGAAGEPVNSGNAKETSAGVVASDGKAGTAVQNGGIGGLAPSPAINAAETNGQKTEAENRPSEMDKRSEATQLAQNKLQQNGQQPSANEANNQEASKVSAAGRAAQEEKQLARDQAPASPAQAPAGQDDRARATKDGYQSSSEQIPPREAQTLPDDSRKSAVIVRPGAVSAEARAKGGGRQTIRPKDSEPPKSESTRDEKERGIAKKGPAREFATGGRTDADSIRKPAAPQLARGQKVERRVENKRFRLLAGIWTDKDFKPDREMPAVTLVRESEVYKSALEKQPGLRGLLAGFAADERVVVVYKNIVYKVVPPKN